MIAIGITGIREHAGLVGQRFVGRVENRDWFRRNLLSLKVRLSGMLGDVRWLRRRWLFG